MRVYFLRFTKQDFTSTGSNQWQTSVIDLYDNAQYSNYSVVKSNYGLQTTGTEWASGTKYTWIGLNSVAGKLTNDNRFIDTTGEVNIVDFTLQTSVTVNPTIDIGLSPDNDANSEFAWQYGFGPINDVDLLDSADRYAQFNLNWDIYPGDDVVLLIRIEVGPPVIAPKYQITRAILNQFPKWMAIREYDDEVTPATPQLSTPNSLGGALINAVAGQWLEDLRARIQHDTYDLYIDTVDTSQMAWCYETTSVPQYIYSVTGDGIDVGRAWNISELFEAASTDDVFWWDEENQKIYSNKEYGAFNINGTLYTQTPSQVWNALDELGLLVDLPRLTLESNTSYQQRIYDVYRNPLGGQNGFKLALRRELNIWSVYGSTPDSNYLGATPEVLEMSDLETDPLYTMPNGIPTSRFRKLVTGLAKQYPTTWGYFLWDKTMWDMGGLNYEGYAVLPNIFDATPLTDSNTQSGVGDGDDLLVERPDYLAGPHSFTAEVLIRGKHKIPQTQYPPVDVSIAITGFANKTIYDNPAETVWFTVEMVPIQGATPSSETYVYSFQLTNTSDVNAFRSSPSAASYSTLNIITPLGSLASGIALQDKVTGDYITPVSFTNEIDTITVKVGRWDFTSQSYQNLPSNVFIGWLTNDPTTHLTSTSGPLTISNNLATPTAMPTLAFQMSSTQTATTSGVWYSPTYTYNLSINDTDNVTEQSPVTITMPSINWDPYVTGSKQYNVQITSNNGAATPTYGGSVQQFDGSVSFLDASYINANGLNAWSNGLQTFGGTTTSLTFSVGSGAAYPTTGSTWEPYTSNPVFYSGIVDENGPWINGIAPPPGVGNSYIYSILKLNRSDFGIPETTDYIINWIGASTTDPQVVAWTDTNAIVPAVTDGSTVYPSGAITETLVAGEYEYSSFNLYIRLAPQPSPQWYPQLHSGTFFEGQQEYFFYATPSEETATTSTVELKNVARQGSPILVRTNDATPIYLRQVCFFDDSTTPDPATPTSQSIVNTEVLIGNGTNVLYASWPDIYDVTVTDITIPSQPASISLVSNTVSDNQIQTTSSTVSGNKYQVNYIVNHSFYADNAYVGTDDLQHTYLVFDSTPASPSYYVIDYETSLYNPATPIAVPLNPLFTQIDEGFIFISHEEYPLSTVIANLNPSMILANGRDYILVTLQSVDQYDNPKPNQTFSLSTTWGTLSQDSVTTNNDGYASVILTADATPPTTNPDPYTSLPRGTISLVGTGFNEKILFQVQSVSQSLNQIYATVSADQIPADLISQNVVYGKVLDSNFNPVPYAYIAWAKARSNFDLFAGQPVESGTVTADVNGVFVIGPFTSATPAGYWMLSTETDSASPNITYAPVGDVVFWYEYANATYGVDNMLGLPPAPIQMSTPVFNLIPYSYGNFYPVDYDESVIPPTQPVDYPIIPDEPPFPPAAPPPFPYPPPNENPPDAATPVLNWVPPAWFGLPQYVQYQLGLLLLGMEHPTVGDV